MSLFKKKQEDGVKEDTTLEYMKKHPMLYLMMIPGLLYYFVFAYMPMEGLLLAFHDYSPFGSIRGEEFVGMKYFDMMFQSSDFERILTNTLLISFLNLGIGFFVPIIIALLLNEVRHDWFKSTVQNIIYIPHFFSWVIVVSISYQMFSLDGGINNILYELTGEKISFLTSTDWFRPLVVGQNIWKTAGWGSIIYLAAIASIDSSLYEAADMDGASRLQKMRYVTIPGISLTISTMLILSVGGVLSSNFDQLFLMVNTSNSSVGDVFDTFIYSQGIGMGRFSFATAMGMFKSVIGFVLILTANYISGKISENKII